MNRDPSGSLFFIVMCLVKIYYFSNMKRSRLEEIFERYIRG